jgi:hypothetical protein
MGREAPNEFREALLSLIEGERDRLCMYLEASAWGDLVAGTSMASWVVDVGDMGIARAPS